MNKRIKELRKVLKLNQANFAEKIGAKQTTVAGWETGGRKPSEPLITSICREFNVNENWLRTGNGEMFNTSSSINFEEYAKQKKMTEFEKSIVINFLNLEPEVRSKIMEMLKKSFLEYAENNNAISEDDMQKINSQFNAINKTNNEIIQKNKNSHNKIDDDLDIEAELESYRRELEAEKNTRMYTASQDTKKA